MVHLVKGNSPTNKELMEPLADAAKDPSIDIPGNERFKVAVIQITAELFTIYAKDGETATKLVLEGDGEFKEKMGRHAGVQGPMVVSAIASKMDGGAVPDFIGMFMQALTGGAASKAPLVQVPTMVPPKGLA